MALPRYSLRIQCILLLLPRIQIFFSIFPVDINTGEEKRSRENGVISENESGSNSIHGSMTIWIYIRKTFFFVLLKEEPLRMFHSKDDSLLKQFKIALINLKSCKETPGKKQ